MKKAKKDKIVLSLEEKKAKRNKSFWNWIQTLIILITIGFYIAFATLWTQKWDQTVFYGNKTTLLIGLVTYTIGILIHATIISKFNALKWLIGILLILTGVILINGTLGFVFGGMVIFLMALEIPFKKSNFQTDFKIKKPKLIETNFATNQK